jgi:hypothetical protein
MVPVVLVISMNTKSIPRYATHYLLKPGAYADVEKRFKREDGEIFESMIMRTTNEVVDYWIGQEDGRRVLGYITRIREFAEEEPFEITDDGQADFFFVPDRRYVIVRTLLTFVPFENNDLLQRYSSVFE